jgi:hypothetical protein
MKVFILEGSILYPILKKGSALGSLQLEIHEDIKTLIPKLKRKKIIMIHRYSPLFYTTYYRLGIMRNEFIEGNFFFNEFRQDIEICKS